MAKKKTIYLESTEVPAERTATEIETLLIEANAKQVLKEFDAGEIVGLHFILDVDNQHIPFKMPVRAEKIAGILRQRRGMGWAKYKSLDEAKAKRIAWRQLLRWVQVQLAMIDTGQVKPLEVFLSYVQMKDGSTFFKSIEDSKYKMLSAGSVDGT